MVHKAAGKVSYWTHKINLEEQRPLTTDELQESDSAAPKRKRAYAAGHQGAIYVMMSRSEHEETSLSPSGRSVGGLHL